MSFLGETLKKQGEARKKAEELKQKQRKNRKNRKSIKIKIKRKEMVRGLSLL